MKRSRFSEEQKVRILQELRAGKSRKEICAEHNVSPQTISLWKSKYGDMDVNEARKLKALEEENARMKRIIADQAMQIDILKEVNSKKW
ncbi:transposase [Rubritalea spongiae]